MHTDNPPFKNQIERIFAFLFPKLYCRQFKNDDDAYMQIMGHEAVCLSSITHLVLLIFNIVVEMPVLAIVCAGTFICDLVCFQLLRKSLYRIFGFAFTLAITVHSLFTSYYLGLGNFVSSYFFLLLLMQVMLIYTSAHLRMAIAIGLFLCTILAMVFDLYVPSRYALTPGASILLSSFNLIVCFLGTLIAMQASSMVHGAFLRTTSMAEQIKKQAHTDSLTGLFNRHYAEQFFHDISRHHSSEHNFLAMLDIDNFKDVNDTYGHAVGDTLLRQMADIMRGNLRKSDVIFRWGGEEFLIVLTDVRADMARHILNKLRVSLANGAITSGDAVICRTVTIGGAALNSSDPVKSIETCDRNLYIGKQNGKNQVVL